MEHLERGRLKWKMLELPDGITTSDGNWYHITRDGIESYVPGLLQEYPLERIIKEADAWVKSSDGMALMLFFVLVYTSIHPLWAFILAIFFYFIWYFNTSVFVNVTATPIAKILNQDGFVYTVSAVLMIGIAMNELIAGMGISVDFNALWYGMVLFFLFKVGLLRLLIQYIRAKFFGKSEVLKQDRILNMLLIRYGMKKGILTGRIDEMEKELIRIATYHKQKKKNK